MTSSRDKQADNRGKHPNSLKNLERGKDTQWKPGQSGNPNGRPPKELSLISLIKEELEQIAEGDKTEAQLVARAIVQAARKAKVEIIKELLDRIDGPVKKKLEVGDEGEITFIVKYENPDKGAE